MFSGAHSILTIKERERERGKEKSELLFTIILTDTYPLDDTSMER